MVRTADACVLVVDLGDDDGPFAAEAVIERLAQVKTMLIGQPSGRKRGPNDPARPDAAGGQQTRTLTGAADRLEIVREMFAERFPIHALDAESGDGLEKLRTAVYQILNVIRVYTSARASRGHGFAVYLSCREHCGSDGRAGPSRFRGEAEVGPHLGARRVRRPDRDARSHAA